MSTNDFLSTVFGGNGGVGAVDAYGKNVAGAAAQGAGAMGQAGIQGIQSYVGQYLPYDRKLMSHVDSIGTDAYRAQQRGQAVNAVQQQTDLQRQVMNRNMTRMGVDPNSARFASMNGMMAGQTALNKVMAANAADRSARDEWVKGLGAINAMGGKLAESSQKSMQTAADMGRVGLLGADLGAIASDRATNAYANSASAAASSQNAATNAANAARQATDADRIYSLNLAKAARQATDADRTYSLNLGRLALDREALTSGNLFKQQVIDTTNKTNSFGNVVLSGLAGAGTKYVFSKDGMETLGSLLDSLLNGGDDGGYTAAGDANNIFLQDPSNLME